MYHSKKGDECSIHWFVNGVLALLKTHTSTRLYIHYIIKDPEHRLNSLILFSGLSLIFGGAT